MRSEHKVVVFKDGADYRVEPGRLIVNVGDVVTFKANRSLDLTITVMFPTPIFIGRAGPNIVLTPGQSESRQVRADAADGVYDYSVLCPDDKNHAVAASEPEIIIDG